MYKRHINYKYMTLPVEKATFLDPITNSEIAHGSYWDFIKKKRPRFLGYL